MNKQRRSQLEQAIGFMQTAANIIEEMKDEEQDSYDNLPEGLQSSDKGEAMYEKISLWLMEDALQQLEEAIDWIVSAKE